MIVSLLHVYRVLLKMNFRTINDSTVYNTEFSIEFFLLNIILGISELPLLIAVLFVMICLKPCDIFLQYGRKYNLYEMHLVYLNIRNATKNVTFDVCNILVNVYPLKGTWIRSDIKKKIVFHFQCLY